MSDDAGSYLFFSLKDQAQVIGHGSTVTFHCLGSEVSDNSSQDPFTSPHSDGKMLHSLHKDVDMKSNRSSGSGTESQGHKSHGNESRGSESNGNESSGSSNSKDLALLESSGSNEGFHSPSPPSSSNAYSLLSSEQDNPSTSGCSSEKSAKAKTQKELIKTLKELKLHFAADKRNRGGASSTLNTLKYAQRCVRQVKANEDQIMMSDNQSSGVDVSSYTTEEIDCITSVYTQKNPDMFAAAVSLFTGKIVYISEQAAAILNCKRDVFKNSKMVEFLSPQDVSVFYSFTSPYRLPSWSMCAEASPSEYIQEKSFFCRISAGGEGNLQYKPFRLTPYLMKVLDSRHTEDQLCCLLLAERVHSGYDAPRIPTNKRVFTTTHTPNCVFQEVDDRVVPLLGYLPQDLIGSPVLLHLHPNDRPIMLGIHKKIMQFAGQPFDHSSIRFCARNGEYITLDTSWSSFIDPWSRKVSFIIARHKVRMNPVNEDVFAAPGTSEVKTMTSDIQDITEQIHRLLLQPVHNNNSSGYGSLSSNDHPGRRTLSDESNENEIHLHAEEEDQNKAKTFHDFYKDVYLLNNQEPRCKKTPALSSVQSPVVRLKEPVHPLNVQDELAFRDQTEFSYQQISCLDSVIRYLESCNVAISVKRKCRSSSNTTSSNSDEDKQKAAGRSLQRAEGSGPRKPPADVSEKPSGSVVASTSLALQSKAESVVSITSQCSYSSTIVHVGDHKKPQAQSEFMEDAPADPAESPAPSLPPTKLSTPGLERETYKKLDLTKPVLAAHTQKEEQAFLYHFRELRGVHAFKPNSHHLGRRKEPAGEHARHCRDGEMKTTDKPCRGSQTKKSKRVKQKEPSSSTESHRKLLFRQEFRGLNQTSRSLSDASLSGFPLQFPAVMPAYPLQVYPSTSAMPNNVETTLAGFGDSQGFSTQLLQSQFPAPLVTPVVALVLPNYVPSQLGSAPHQHFYSEQTFVSSQTTFPVQTPCTATNPFPTPSFTFQVQDKQTKPAAPEVKEAPWQSSAPPSVGRQDPSPPLFQSRCSSPLQLQLEDKQCLCERQDTATQSNGPYGITAAKNDTDTGAQAGMKKEQDNAAEVHHCDVLSSSDLLEILMQEDSRSVTGSATSGSRGSASNDCGTSASGSGESASRTGSINNSSNYFGSVDSSQESRKIVRKRFGRGVPGHMDIAQGESLIKCVLQDPLWLLAANTDKTVMMTYQLRSRDVKQVLLEDCEKLKQMQKNQPQFSDEQIKELAKVHPWIKEGGLPKAIDTESGEDEISDLCRAQTEVSDVTGPSSAFISRNTHTHI